MEKLNFYVVDSKYVEFLKAAELQRHGVSHVPEMNYGMQRKPKFLCGVVLQINGHDYYAPVTSYKKKKPDNFLIYAANGHVVGSLRFNYMFPIPKEFVSERRIDDEPDLTYRSLLSQELRFCIKNKNTIRRLAERTYKRVILGKNPGLVVNSCDFPFLEERCLAYMNRKPGLQEQILNAERKAFLKAKNVPAKENCAEFGLDRIAN